MALVYGLVATKAAEVRRGEYAGGGKNGCFPLIDIVLACLTKAIEMWGGLC